MMTPKPNFELSPEQLRFSCNATDTVVCGTEEAEHSDEIIGQERAVDAIRLGLQVEKPGYNVFVVGYSGTGRSTAIRKMLEHLGLGTGEPPEDVCYANNFRNPDVPRLLLFPPGDGSRFRDEMQKLISDLRDTVPGLLDSDELRSKRKAVLGEFDEKQKNLLRSFENAVKEKQFAMTQVQVGPMTRPDVSPVVGGAPVAIGELESRVEAGEFPKDRFEAIKTTYDELTDEMARLFRQMRENQKELATRMEQLQVEVVGPKVYQSIAGIKAEFSTAGLEDYLDEVHEDIIKHLDQFEHAEEDPAKKGPIAELGPADRFLAYSVNVLVDNSNTKDKPIVSETNPNYKNLFGSIERIVDQRGFWRTDYTRIKAGALHRANGGYLILDAADALIEPGVWQGLKRTLRSGKIEIQAYDPVFLFSQTSLKPEPIDLNLQVIMVGMPDIYYLLYRLDPDFSKIFKVKAEFDTVMGLNESNLGKYSAFARKIVGEMQLLPFDKNGMGAVVEYGVRLAGRSNKLSTRFHVLTDMMCEASHWARQDGSESVTDRHVNKAIDEWIKRVSLPEDKIGEMIEEGTILVDTEGAVVGQINGLSVYSLGEYSFGQPTRITARTSVGAQGIINIEKEAQLSGSSHSKGVMIISGYLQGKFAQNKPLSVNAHLCFEQSYGGVDGDSASSTEIYAILSSLAGVPIQQGIAVTGSVNQNGFIQAIGGVNEKIEGFYATCKKKGLTGDQGVVIPTSNTANLMLRNEVVQAVREGKFHVYAVSTIEEGIELLTGMEAGTPLDDGSYPEGTLFHLVEKKIDAYAEAYRRYCQPSNVRPQ
jgi:lon-related putative ATP-dependent protease